MKTYDLLDIARRYLKDLDYNYPDQYLHGKIIDTLITYFFDFNELTATWDSQRAYIEFSGRTETQTLVFGQLIALTTSLNIINSEIVNFERTKSERIQDGSLSYSVDSSAMVYKDALKYLVGEKDRLYHSLKRVASETTYYKIQDILENRFSEMFTNG